VTSDRLNNVLSQVQNIQKQQNATIEIKLTDDGYLDDSSLDQIYDKLNSSDLDSENISEKYNIYNAIQVMVDSAKDPYTVFFPPTEAEQFNEEMQ
jgi:C-terminal processing protease CtpA/Prc